MGGAPSTLLHEPSLLLGGADVLQTNFLDGIDAVISVCDKRPSSREGLAVLHINLADAPGTQLAPSFSEAAQFIHTARAAAGGGAVYIHCTAGISRSTTIAAAYLMALLGLTRNQALGHIHRCRETACPNEGFLQQLQQFEGAAATAVGEQLAALQLPNHDALKERDLRSVAESLRAASEAARIYSESKWFYRDDATPVPPQLLAFRCDPGDGNGPRVPVEISKRHSDPEENLAGTWL
jgi:protein-tyrosine phosphatase